MYFPGIEIETKKLTEKTCSNKSIQLAALRPRSARRSPLRRRSLLLPLAATAGPPRSSRARPSRRLSPSLPPPRPVSRRGEREREKERRRTIGDRCGLPREKTSGGQRSCFVCPFFFSTSTPQINPFFSLNLFHRNRAPRLHRHWLLPRHRQGRRPRPRGRRSPRRRQLRVFGRRRRGRRRADQGQRLRRDRRRRRPVQGRGHPAPRRRGRGQVGHGRRACEQRGHHEGHADAADEEGAVGRRDRDQPDRLVFFFHHFFGFFVKQFIH